MNDDTGYAEARLCDFIKKSSFNKCQDIYEAGVPSGSRAGRCKILRSIGKAAKPTIKPPLKQRHKLACLDWAKSCMKTNFENVLFTDESQAFRDGRDGWMSGWLPNGTTPQSKIRRQQGGGGVMIWAGISNNQIVSPFRVPDRVKMCAESYVDFLKKIIFLGIRNNL